MTAIVDRLKAYRRRKHPGGLGTGSDVYARLSESEALALDFIIAETNTDKSAVTRLALNRLFREVLAELGVPLRNFGLEDA